MTTGAAGPYGQGLPRTSSVLAVCAHPDDESFGLGAVLDSGWGIITAIDISEEALDRLHHGATSDPPVVTLVDDITTYLVGVQARGDAFDLVMLPYLHPEPAKRAELLHATASVVAPGGYLFVVGHHCISHGVAGPFDPSRLYTDDDLRHAAHELPVLRLEQRHGKIPHRRARHRRHCLGSPARTGDQANFTNIRCTSSSEYPSAATSSGFATQ